MRALGMAMSPDERDAMAFILAGDDPTLAVLRAQAAAASVTSREGSSGGFYAHFQVPAAEPRLPNLPRFQLSDVACNVADIECGLILFVADGALDFLECHVWGPGDLQPHNRSISDLSYLASGGRVAERDMDSLRAKLRAA
jgi:hypothetical protein